LLVRNLGLVLVMSNVVRALLPFFRGVPVELARWGSKRLLLERRPVTATTTHQVAHSSRLPASLKVVPVLGVGAVSIGALLRARYLRWGATDDERTRALLGDELLPQVNVSTTRAITVKGPAGQVWPWIAQLGQGRGGFYSYDGLENLVARIDIHNADQIVPAWQHVAVGSEVRLAPQLPLQVAALDVGRGLVLRGNVPIGKGDPPYDFTWAFVLLPQADGSTRLIVRERYAYTHRWAALIVQPAQLVSCFMSPEMLRGIKTRAERLPAAAPGTRQHREPAPEAETEVPSLIESN
jgi:hypothetical protein